MSVVEYRMMLKEVLMACHIPTSLKMSLDGTFKMLAQ
jgi:hypothetical protein